MSLANELRNEVGLSLESEQSEADERQMLVKEQEKEVKRPNSFLHQMKMHHPLGELTRKKTTLMTNLLVRLRQKRKLQLDEGGPLGLLLPVKRRRKRMATIAMRKK